MSKELKDHNEIKLANSEFYDALNLFFKGEIEPMKAIWSHSDEVSFLGPQGGILVGWNNVLNALKKQADLKLGGHIDPQDIHIILDGDIAIIQNNEVGENNVDHQAQPVRIRATNIFRKEGDEWKLISHQTDLLPYLKGK